MFLVVDTETTGLLIPGAPADGYAQPRLASIAMLPVDANCDIESESHLFVSPDGWEMTLGGEAIHGLTDQILTERGVPVINVLNQYSGFVSEGRTIVAFNAFYDAKVMRGELRRAGMPDLYNETRTFCLMHAMARIMGSRWPKLSEAHRFCFGEVHADQHDALGDAKAAARILKWMFERNHIPMAA